MYKFAALGLGLTLSAVALTASAAAPAVACSGAVTGSQVLWSSSVVGGAAPLSYLWSNGATSTTQTITYGTPGIHTIGLRVTDASSTVGTASCVATTVATSTSLVTNNCQATSSVPVSVKSALIIGPEGNIEAQGLKVLTVGAGSFTARVWGVTYTVNSTQTVTVGNYVKLNGKISTTAPMVIDTRMVEEVSAMKIKRNNDCQQDTEHGWGWILKKDMQKNLKDLKDALKKNKEQERGNNGQPARSQGNY